MVRPIVQHKENWKFELKMQCWCFEPWSDFSIHRAYWEFNMNPKLYMWHPLQEILGRIDESVWKVPVMFPLSRVSPHKYVQCPICDLREASCDDNQTLEFCLLSLLIENRPLWLVFGLSRDVSTASHWSTVSQTRSSPGVLPGKIVVGSSNGFNLASL